MKVKSKDTGAEIEADKASADVLVKSGKFERMKAEKKKG